MAVGWLYIRKYQQKLVTVYIKQSAQRFLDRSNLPQGTCTGFVFSFRPSSILASSASFTQECSRGLLRKNMKKIAHHTAAVAANCHMACRHVMPPISTSN